MGTLSGVPFAAGLQPAADSVDESHMRMFDEFWCAHVQHSVFEPHMDSEDFMDYEDGAWDDGFMSDDAYGYMEDGFGYMDDPDDDDGDVFDDLGAQMEDGPDGAELVDLADHLENY